MKALVGSWDRRPYHLLAEITALRARVSELHEELERAREENETLRRALTGVIDDGVTVDAAEQREVALSTR